MGNNMGEHFFHFLSFTRHLSTIEMIHMINRSFFNWIFYLDSFKIHTMRMTILNQIDASMWNSSVKIFNWFLRTPQICILNGLQNSLQVASNLSCTISNFQYKQTGTALGWSFLTFICDNIYFHEIEEKNND